ncbi:YrzI family small protein [Neobacillus vireti]|uniref:YrzI family small protein n=1 Tax=Neobacillus vireti LMG 21834 TaxID=1131730 RepID=A0AB94IPA4_9BACI|nr:YrzI family small protein [Neobacillus vireti]ETI68842.1 hypothetical protein BAVI_10702 [Neobacillus vireti LMG 21834]
MTLNLLFFTLSIKKRIIAPEKALTQEKVEKLYEEHKDRLISTHYMMH